MQKNNFICLSSVFSFANLFQLTGHDLKYHQPVYAKSQSGQYMSERKLIKY